MRVGVFVGTYNPRSGGAFTFVEEIVQALSSQTSTHEFLFICESEREQEGFLLFNRSGAGLQQRILRKLFRFWPSLASRLGYKTDSDKLNDLIDTYGLDSIYFASPEFIRTRVPTIMTVWDLAHRLYPFFPEVNYEGWKWEDREDFYRRSLPMAAAIVTGTAEGKRQIVHHYGVHAGRVHVIPFPTPSFALKAAESPQSSDAEDVAVPFFYYPAQFWSHKNHILLLRAWKKLKDNGVRAQLVLSGSNQGNLSYIQEVIEDLSLADCVNIVGFVDREEMLGLYRRCVSIVYPSYFGPDNLPPLEAMALGTPVLVADIEGARDQLGNAAIYFSPSDEDDLVSAVLKILSDEALRSALILCGKERALRWTASEYAKSLIEIFDEVEKFRRCWK